AGADRGALADVDPAEGPVLGPERAAVRVDGARIVVVGDDRGRADEDAVGQAGAVVDERVVLDLAVVADRDLGADVDVLAEDAVGADAGAAADLGVVPDARAGADDRVALDVGGRVDPRGRVDTRTLVDHGPSLTVRRSARPNGHRRAGPVGWRIGL